MIAHNHHPPSTPKEDNSGVLRMRDNGRDLKSGVIGHRGGVSLIYFPFNLIKDSDSYQCI